MLSPKFADENSSEMEGRGSWELHTTLVGHESIVPPERLNLEHLKRVIGKHAMFDFAKNMKLGSLAVAIGFHRLKVIGEKFRVGVFIFFLERIPRGPHLRFQQVSQLGLSR